MKTWVENLVLCEIVIKLSIDYLLQDLTEWGQNGHWSVVFGIKLAELLVQWYQFCILPACWEPLLHDGKCNYMVHWDCYELVLLFY